MSDKSSVKILIIDENPCTVEFISYILKKESYKVFIANNEYQAIEIAKSEKPDLIILDTMVPYIYGINICKKIRAIKELENIVITFLSSRNEDYVQISGLDAGADDFIIKPVNSKILIRKISALLRRKSISCKTEFR